MVHPLSISSSDETRVAADPAARRYRRPREGSISRAQPTSLPSTDSLVTPAWRARKRAQTFSGWPC